MKEWMNESKVADYNLMREQPQPEQDTASGAAPLIQISSTLSFTSDSVSLRSLPSGLVLDKLRVCVSKLRPSDVVQLFIRRFINNHRAQGV